MGGRGHRVEQSIIAVVYQSHGNPAEVLSLEKIPCPSPGPGQALVRVQAAPVNPADLNAIEGKYPVRPVLPATPGFEGAGVVVRPGPGVTDPPVNARVILPHNVGTWREALVVNAADLVVYPDEIEPAQAAMLKINPLTAWRLLHGYVELKSGEWLIQNAANSAAGRAVIQIAHESGLKTVNVVRRAELFDELKAEGGDVVLLDDDSLGAAVKTATDGARIRLGLNAVGGDSALRLMNTLAFGGTLVSYGAMSLQPLKVPTGLLLFKDLRLRGMWINKWYDEATPEERINIWRPLLDMARRGVLKAKIERTYPLGEVKSAVGRAAEGKRGGKVVLQISS